ncbi:hypothetical protein [Streptomyces sp. NPDC056628]|uniref:hypothetical protein n=1 Tax=Streptomyces sp. NPDC056628 TaxID=3345882 RepID=UPI0036C4ACFA
MFFYSTSGAAASGKLDASGNYINLRDFPQGQFSKWTHIASLDSGQLFFYNNGEQGTQAASGRLDADGEYTNLVDFPTNQFGHWSIIVPLDGARLFFYSDTGAAAIGKLDEDGNYINLRDFPQGQFSSWTHIVPLAGGRLFFYNGNFGEEPTGTQAASGEIDLAGNYTNLKDFQADQFGRWTDIAPVNRTQLFFYHVNVHKASCGKLDASGDYVHQHDTVVLPGGDWWKVVSVGSSRLFLYNGGTPTRAASGEVNSAGEYKQLVSFHPDQFGRWDIIVA